MSLADSRIPLSSMCARRKRGQNSKNANPIDPEPNPVCLKSKAPKASEYVVDGTPQSAAENALVAGSVLIVIL